LFINFAYIGPFDCTNTSCGSSFQWLYLSNYLDYVHKGTESSNGAKCADGTVVPTRLNPLICKCPTFATDISPCVCAETDNSMTTVTVSCAGQNINDTKMASIVNNIPVSTPMEKLDVRANQLTKMPPKLPTFTQLVYLLLASNAITSIASGDLNLTGPVHIIDLSSNRITFIDSSTTVFPGIYLI